MSQSVIKELMVRYPALSCCEEAIMAAFNCMVECYEQDNVIYTCGNGGSASDAEHIVGELMKSFARARPVDSELVGDVDLSKRLEGALRAIALTGHPSLSTAYANDVAPEMVFAQQIFGYGRPGDIVWGLSTSGNSKNVLQALRVARARGLKTIGMTGKDGGAMFEHCDVCIRVPEAETFKVQELHLPIYHAFCRMLEDHFFGN